MEGRNLAKNFFTKSQERTFDSENHFEIKNSEQAHTKKSIISMISTLQNKRVAPATQNDFYTNNHNYKPKVENLPRNNFLPRQVKKSKNGAAKQSLAKFLNVDKDQYVTTAKKNRSLGFLDSSSSSESEASATE